MPAISQLGDLDPALAEAVRIGEGDADIPVIARLNESAVLPEGVRVITRFGDIATLRVKQNRIDELIESNAVSDMEASRSLRRMDDAEHDFQPEFCEAPYDTEDMPLIEDELSEESSREYTRRPPAVTATGQGCVVGVLDWGLDFAFPSFRHADGRTRIEALWDQRGDAASDSNNRWGYGRILDRAAINRALENNDPYDMLDYYPSDADSRSKDSGEWQGSHGTHVMDIAAGNGNGGGMSGVAPGADLVFVHLSRTADVLSLENLGDSASVLEAIDFVFSIAGDRPCVINMSVGAHGGPHDGMTLVEQGIDRAVWLNKGKAIINSAGNYFTARAHAQGRLKTGQQTVLEFNVPENDPTPSELEVYYENTDHFIVSVKDGEGNTMCTAVPGEDCALMHDGVEVGHLYHRLRQAGSGDRHIDLFLQRHAPGGTWQLQLQAEQVEDGRFHAWIERDRGPRPSFISQDVSTSTTTGTICNSKFSITVGAYDPFLTEHPIGRFSSAGPTRDGRIKPEIVAPGVHIMAARSAPPGSQPAARYTSKNGTSMAAPHVTGTIAVMFEAAVRPLEISDTRALLFASLDSGSLHTGDLPIQDLHRLGYGYLNIASAEQVAREWRETDDVLGDSVNASSPGSASSPVAETQPETSRPLVLRPHEVLADSSGIAAQGELNESLLQAISSLLPSSSPQIVRLALSLLDQPDNKQDQDKQESYHQLQEWLQSAEDAEQPYETGV